jgi:hypothetical protein
LSRNVAADRHAATDQTGVATLERDGDARVRTRAYDRGDLGGVRRPDHAAGLAGEPPGPVRLVRRLEIRIDQYVPFPDDAGEHIHEVAHDSTRSRMV